MARQGLTFSMVYGKSGSTDFVESMRIPCLVGIVCLVLPLALDTGEQERHHLLTASHCCGGQGAVLLPFRKGNRNDPLEHLDALRLYGSL